MVRKIRWLSALLQPRWSPPGEISVAGVWTWSDGGWLYISKSLPGLYWQMLTEWKHDTHLGG